MSSYPLLIHTGRFGNDIGYLGINIIVSIVTSMIWKTNIISESFVNVMKSLEKHILNLITTLDLAFISV
jgi:hypothetical protein